MAQSLTKAQFVARAVAALEIKDSSSQSTHGREAAANASFKLQFDFPVRDICKSVLVDLTFPAWSPSQIVSASELQALSQALR